MRVEESIIVDRTPEEVFVFFNDRSNDKRSMASVVESEWLDPSAQTGGGRGGVLGNLLAPVTRSVVRRNYRGDLRRLKDILEGQERTDP